MLPFVAPKPPAVAHLREGEKCIARSGKAPNAKPLVLPEPKVPDTSIA
jgi:hypothetical protein